MKLFRVIVYGDYPTIRSYPTPFIKDEKSVDVSYHHECVHCSVVLRGLNILLHPDIDIEYKLFPANSMLGIDSRCENNLQKVVEYSRNVFFNEEGDKIAKRMKIDKYHAVPIPVVVVEYLRDKRVKTVIMGINSVDDFASGLLKSFEVMADIINALEHVKRSTKFERVTFRKTLSFDDLMRIL